MIRTKTKGREGRDDVSFDLDDEEEEKDDGECKRRGESGDRRKREKDEIYKRDDHLRSTRSVNNTKADCGRG